MQVTLHVVQEIAPNATLGEHTVWCKWEGALSYKWGMIITQMGDALLPKWGTHYYQHLGDALSYRWGMHSLWFPFLI